MALPANADRDALQAMRERICEFGRMMLDMNLTDVAGGNISARVGDLICMSPRYSGSLRQWQLDPEDILIVDMQRNILEGDGQISRETNAHFKFYEEFGDYGSAVIHGHARNALVFATMQQPMPPVLEANRKFGTIPVVPYAPAHTEVLADHLVAAIRGHEDRIAKQAFGALAPWHGIFLMGKDLDAAFDAVQRWDTNAYVIMMAQSIGGKGMLAEQREQMEAAITNFKE